MATPITILGNFQWFLPINFCPPFPLRGEMGGDWPPRHVAHFPNRRIQQTRRVLWHGEGGSSRGCHCMEGLPSSPPTPFQPQSCEWGSFCLPRRGQAPPGPPPSCPHQFLTYSTTNTPIAPCFCLPLPTFFASLVTSLPPTSFTSSFPFRHHLLTPS